MKLLAREKKKKKGEENKVYQTPSDWSKKLVHRGSKTQEVYPVVPRSNTTKVSGEERENRNKLHSEKENITY